ncbi:MAG: prolyl oligopeptidase family serine peptidase, partial [Planctomycetia bacterium]|nr:prolyl oligopeptidase family serine peptidase [Planctomycetia bacterium]
MPDSAPKIDPGKQFQAYILKRHHDLRGNEKLPTTADEWLTMRQELRDMLLESWGGFPREACDLVPHKLGELKRDGYRLEKIVFQTRPGVFMTANAYVPDGGGKRPAVLCVHGHWKGAKQDPVPQSRCIGLAKLGFFVLGVDAFGAGERGIGKALGEYHGEMVGSTLLPIGLPLSGLQVYENMRAVDYLLTRPEVDGSKLGITGASGGGNQSMYAGAFDERFSCVVPVCSVGTYKSYLAAACCVCELVPDAMTYTEEWGILSLVAPRALMVINATKDAFQFSVGEAQQSVAKVQHVYRLFAQAGKVAHAIFESGHDYGKEMREAMYGWMTLHLKGEGKGNPIPEPVLTPEDPEIIRCYPGESRPDNFVTIPRFAAAEADRLIALHNREAPQHKEEWDNAAMRMRHVLEHKVLGGFPRLPVSLPKFEKGIGFSLDGARIETEPGIRMDVAYFENQTGKGAVILFDQGNVLDVQLLEAFGKTSWKYLFWFTGRPGIPGDKIGRGEDHNAAEWSIWTGRPLLGQWIWDARVTLEAIAKHDRAAFAEATLIGFGRVALAALGAAIFDQRV